MTKAIQAIYEEGVIRPLQPLEISSSLLTNNLKIMVLRLKSLRKLQLYLSRAQLILSRAVNTIQSYTKKIEFHARFSTCVGNIRYWFSLNFPASSRFQQSLT